MQQLTFFMREESYNVNCKKNFLINEVSLCHREIH